MLKPKRLFYARFSKLVCAKCAITKKNICIYIASVKPMMSYLLKPNHIAELLPLLPL